MRIIILVMSLISIQLGAQTITNYTTADGLISDFVECIDVGGDGNVWLGTPVGIQQFDGTSLATFNVANSPGMLSDNIKCIKAGGSYLFVGTDYGINYQPYTIVGSSWSSFTTVDGLISNQVKSIDEGGAGYVFIGTNSGLTIFHPTTLQTQSYSSPDLHWSGVTATAFDSNADLWFAAPLGGVTHYDGINFTVYDTSNGLISQNVTDIVIDDQDNKWIGTGSGISVLDATNTTFTHHTQMYILSPPDTLNPVVDLEIDGFGRIWAAIYVGYLAQGGIAMWDGNQWIDYDVADGIAGQNIRGLSTYGTNVWVATSTGVSKISNITSFVNENDILDINVFPNPTNDVLYLNNKDKIIQEIKIYNALGNLIYAKKAPNHKYNIDFSSFKKGLYYVNARFDDSIICKKIVVN